MNHKLLILYMITGLFLFSGCKKEIFDPKALEKNYFIQNIPADFDWSTVSEVQAEVVPFDQYGGQYKYTIEFFDKNPLIDPTASRYAIGWCTENAPLKKTITVPDGQTSVFVRQTTPGGRKTVAEAEIINSKLVCNFNPSTVTPKSRAATRSDNDDKIPEKVPSDAIPISSSSSSFTMKKGKDYVIEGTYTGTLTFPEEGKCSLYITGTWINTAGEWQPTLLQNNGNIHIMEGGKLLAQSKCKFQCSNHAVITVAPGGQLGDEGKNNVILQLQTNGRIINYGNLYADAITAESPQMLIINNGTLHANLLSSREVNYTFKNQCYADIKVINLSSNSKIEIAAYCYLTCETLNISRSDIELSSSAMLQVSTLKSSGEIKSSISGNGKEPALVRIGELSCQWSNKASIIFEGENLYIGCSKYPADSQLYQIDCKQEAPETGPTFEIKPSKCSKGNGYTPENPQQPEFPKEVTVHQNYTFASEDNYPSPGDYDMNDLVLSLDSVTYYYVEEKAIRDENNDDDNGNDDDDENISKLTWHFTLRAVGATRQLGAAIQLDKLKPGHIQSVSYSKNMSLDNFDINSNHTEKGQDHAVIPLFDNAHKMLGCANTSTIINTISNNPENPQWIYDVAPFSFEVTVAFTSPVEDDDVEIKELNYFTIVGTKTLRTEIHIPKYKHTNLSNNSKVLKEMADKFMWTLRIPGKFLYPHEWTSITDVYEYFEEWVQSDKKNHKDWYLSAKKELLYKKQ